MTSSVFKPSISPFSGQPGRKPHQAGSLSRPNSHIVCHLSLTTTNSFAAPPLLAPPKPETSRSLPPTWRDIQGSNNWEHLLHPLHPLLRDEILRYGEFLTACYTAFDLDPTSKRYLKCKYGKKNVFKEVGLGNCGYNVTKYIYATPDINMVQSCGYWIGYVAVASDEQVRKLGRRDVVIAFRGTVTRTEWAANLMSSLTPARLDPHDPRPEVKVESGFLSLYTSHDTSNKFGHGSCREQLLSEISRIVQEYGGEEMSITVAGHSMGSSLAVLLAYDIAEVGLKREETAMTVYSFGGPRVGNSGFKERCEELGVKVLRIANVNDPVTKLPGVFFNENFRALGGRYELPWSCSCYAHVGVELALDRLFAMHNPSRVHDLDTYVGLLRRPKLVQLQEEGDHVFRRTASQNLEGWPWQEAARSVGNFLQSLRSTS